MICKAIWRRLVFCLLGVVLIAGLFTVLLESSFMQEAAKPGKTKPEPTPASVFTTTYRVVKIECSSKSDCLVFADVNEDDFECSKMSELAVQLKTDFAMYTRIRVLLFDSPVIASQYLRGIRSPRDIDKDIRGVYEHGPAKLSGFVQFSRKKGGKFDEVRINLE